MFLCAFSPAQPAELFPVLCFKAGVCVTHSKWHMWCSFLFQAVFWQIGSLVQAPCHCPSTPNPHPMSYHVSTHSWLLKMPVLCHNEVSKLTFNAHPRFQYSYGVYWRASLKTCTQVPRKLWASFLLSLAHQLIWNCSIKVTELHWCEKSMRRESTSLCRLMHIRVLASDLTQPEWPTISTLYFQLSKGIGFFFLHKLEYLLSSRCNTENKSLLPIFSLE